MYRIFFCCLLLGCAHADSDVPTNKTVFVYVETGLPINEICENCMAKCCPRNQVIVMRNDDEKCEEYATMVKLQDMKVDIYSKDFEKMPESGKTLKDFRFVYNEIFTDFYNNTIHCSEDERHQIYLLETGKVLLRQLNYLQQWTEPMSYEKICLDIEISSVGDVITTGSEQLVFKQLLSKDSPSYVNTKKKDKVSASAMLVSCFFLLLVLVAYAVLPEKRNQHSLMLMTYVSCLFIAFLLTAVQVFTEEVDLEKKDCIAIGLIVYYTMLASFTWMNVMSYDMWYTTCKPQSFIPKVRRKILIKFGWYSIYGFGAPLLTTVFFVGIDYADLTSIPNFIQPHYMNSGSLICNFESENERRLYVNAPILVATVINIVFFVITATYIWRNSVKPGESGDSRNTKKDQNRFLIYVKLTLVMGVNWILDVLGAVISPDSWVWYLPDIFNALVGLFIFIIFVCKRNMLVRLCKRFSINKRIVCQREESTMNTNLSVTRRQPSDKEAGLNFTVLERYTDKPTGRF